VLFKRERKDSTNIIMRKFLSPTIINRLKKRLFLLKKLAKNTHNTEKIGRRAISLHHVDS
jgi:hypothetical protein